MKKEKGKLEVIVNILCVLYVITFFFLVRFMILNYLAEMEIFSLAALAGTEMATNDFREGKMRIYNIVSNGKREFAGKQDSQFEIWNWPYYAKLGRGHRHGQQTLVKAYNRRMRFLVTQNNELALD
ncbi:MAG: hypothetical protein KJ915_11905 [Candidatus Omnitrophica bacterium]|nr:hypothetical protein [Candidatus Omnitrophota bacterium]